MLKELGVPQVLLPKASTVVTWLPEINVVADQTLHQMLNSMVGYMFLFLVKIDLFVSKAPDAMPIIIPDDSASAGNAKAILY